MLASFKNNLVRYILSFASRLFSSRGGKPWFVENIPYFRDRLSASFSSHPKHVVDPYKLFEVLTSSSNVSVPSPIFITGRFRSGSTLLWNIFRGIPGIDSYYEPFNERRWFDEGERGSKTDGSHIGVSDYWREYDGLERLADFYDESWIDQNLYMDEKSWSPDMRAFIELLIDSSKRRPVLQFNRIDFRLAWIKSTFPTSKIVHIYRNPRDQWMSFIKSPELCMPTHSFSDLGHMDFFYLRRWGRDLKYIFPFLSEDHLAHPYQLFYLIWRLSYDHGIGHADHCLALERLVASPESELSSLFHVLEIDPTHISLVLDKVKPITVEKWKLYADDRWFDQQEAACDRLLGQYFTVNANS